MRGFGHTVSLIGALVLPWRVTGQGIGAAAIGGSNFTAAELSFAGANSLLTETVHTLPLDDSRIDKYFGLAYAPNTGRTYAANYDALAVRGFSSQHMNDPYRPFVAAAFTAEILGPPHTHTSAHRLLSTQHPLRHPFFSFFVREESERESQRFMSCRATAGARGQCRYWRG